MKNRGLLFKRVGLIAALTVAALRGGADTNITENLTLDADLDLREFGAVTIAAGATVDLAGHKLTVKGLSCAGNIVNSESGYQPLEYIQSNGKQWIDTGYLTTDKTAIEIDFTVTGDFGNTAYFCGDWADYGHLLIANVDGKKVKFLSWYGANNRILSPATAKRYRFITVPGGANTAILYDGVTGEQLSATGPSLAHTGTGEMTLFAANEAGQYPSSYRLHSFRMTDTTTGKVERDYVPVRRLSDGELGLYDRAHDLFYPKHENSKASFVAGADAAKPVVASGRLVVDVSDGAAYAVSGQCAVRVEISDGSVLSADGDLRCFGKNLEVGGTVSLNGHRLRVAGLGGSGTVVNNGGFRYYRFKVDAVRSGTLMQIGEVKLFSGDIEVTRNYTKIEYPTTSEWVGKGFSPDKALDGSTGTKWFDDTSVAGCGPGLLYFDLDYGSPVVITRYQWCTGDDTAKYNGRNPKSWRLQGSNDKTNWTDLDVVENNTSVTTANKTLAYNKLLMDTQNRNDALEVEASDGYRYYKFKVDAVRSGTLMQIGEFKLFSGDTDVSSQYTALDYSLNTQYNKYTPEKCFDGLNGEPNKWFDNRSTDLMYFILDYGSPVVITRYQWYTGNDTSSGTGRNPKSWRLQGSNDGETWRDLDVVSENVSVPTANSTLAYEKDLSVELSARMVDVFSLVKSGAGTVLVPDTVLASVANVAIDEGVVKVKRTGFVKAASTPGEIHIADGAQLDLNAIKTSGNTLSVAEAIHGKTIYAAGEGPDGKGAIYSSLAVQDNYYTGPQLGAVVLTDDALLGSANGRIDMRELAGSSAAATTATTLLAGGHTLTVGDMGSGGFFAMNKMGYALDMMRVTGRASFELNLTGTVTNGVWLANGAWVGLAQATAGTGIPFVVEPNATAEVNATAGASTLNGSFTVGAGAMLSVACAYNLTLAGAVTNEGAVAQTGANALILAGTLSGGGSLAGAKVRFAGASTCWRMVADDTDFTSRVDVDGVTDATFLAGLKRMEIVYTGAEPAGKVLTICSADAYNFTQLDADDFPLSVTDGEGNPIENCWLEVADGLLKVHFAEPTPKTAEWTNGSGDGDVANSANWNCRDGEGRPISGVVPTHVTTVLIGADSRFVCTNEAPMVCLKVKFEPGASLAADCDWRGLAGVPFEGTLDLAGHRLIVGSLLGPATLTDDGHGAGFKYIRFKVRETQGSVLHAEGGRDVDDSAQLCEVKLFNGANDVTRPYKQLIYDEATFDSGFKATLNPTMAVDGNLGTEWFDNRLSKDDAALRDSVWFVLEYENPIVLTHYEWYSGLDTISTKGPAQINRHPQEWQLEGSNDGENWVMLDALHANVACPANKALSYRGPAMDPAVTPGIVQIDVPAGKTETNESVALQNGVRLVKTGEGTFVAACAGQTYAGGTVVSEGVVKPSQADVSSFGLNNTSRFGLMNSVLSVEEGAQYWDDVYAPGATKNIRFRIAGTGPDGTGAIRTSHKATSGENKAETWCTGLELSGDAEIARDAYAFSLIAYYYQRFPLTLNGHTLTFTSDTLTTSPNYPFLLAASVKGTPGDAGTIVIGDNIQFYPYGDGNYYAGDLSNYTLVVSTNAVYSTKGYTTDSDLSVSNFVHRSTSNLSPTNKLTTVLGSYAPVSTTSAPRVQLGDATHLKPTLDLSERTTAFAVDFGGGLTFAPGSVVNVRLGSWHPNGERLLSWDSRPEGIKFVLCDKNLGGVFAREDGLYLVSGMIIIFR